MNKILFRDFVAHYMSSYDPIKDFSKAESIQPDIAIDDMHACDLGKINLIVREK